MPQLPAKSTPEEAFQEILRVSPAAVEDVNSLTIQAFQTRGGRIGSGLGGVIEALWGFYVNKHLLNSAYGIELAWISGHEYNDFACLTRDVEWEPDTKDGELLRIEVKSMVKAADESKAHFDRLKKELTPTDILAVFLWDWVAVDTLARRSYPKITASFVGRANSVAELRDQLHIARGGAFVESAHCPDGCQIVPCSHDGEPLNAKGIRERLSGPESTRGTGKSSYAANFGGLVRMLGARSQEAQAILQKVFEGSDDQNRYVRFIETNFGKRALAGVNEVETVRPVKPPQ
jgi:hypothetical protein